MFVELTQKHIEDWTNALPDADKTKALVYQGDMVRAAAKAGWFKEPINPDDVSGMKPARVKELAMAIGKAFNEAMEISPE